MESQRINQHLESCFSNVPVTTTRTINSSSAFTFNDPDVAAICFRYPKTGIFVNFQTKIPSAPTKVQQVALFEAIMRKGMAQTELPSLKITVCT